MVLIQLRPILLYLSFCAVRYSSSRGVLMVLSVIATFKAVISPSKALFSCKVEEASSGQRAIVYLTCLHIRVVLSSSAGLYRKSLEAKSFFLSSV
jgi:hypothetical protein